MIKNIYFISVSIIVLFASCKENNKQDIIENEKEQISYNNDTNYNFSLSGFLTDDTATNKITEQIFNSLNDTERVAQMIMSSAGNNGKPKETVRNLIANKKIGGVILMGGSKDSFKKIIQEFNSLIENNKYLPLFYSIDAEPGFMGSRITGVKSMLPQSNIKSIDQMDTIAVDITKILNEIGININLAPVCDVSTNKEIISNRSFGKDDKKIIELASLFIKRMQEKNVISTVKHFPGHGNIKGDSHKEVVYIDGKLGELEIFREIINSANPAAVMIGHIAVNNNLEFNTGALPSSMSRKIVTELLRKHMGYKGLIITDAMNMGAVTKIDKPSFKAALAGCDIILMPTDEIRLLHSILTEMNLNPDFKNQIYDSVKRIIKAKICVGLLNTKLYKNYIQNKN